MKKAGSITGNHPQVNMITEPDTVVWRRPPVCSRQFYWGRLYSSAAPGSILVFIQNRVTADMFLVLLPGSKLACFRRIRLSVWKLENILEVLLWVSLV